MECNRTVLVTVVAVEDGSASPAGADVVLAAVEFV